MKDNKDELYEAVEREAKAAILLNAVFESEGDLITGACTMDEEKYDGFQKAIEILSGLKAKGKCDFEAMDIDEPYELHAIQIKWNVTTEPYVEIDSSNKKEIQMLLDCMEDCLICDDEGSNWQLSSKIYIPIED